MHIKEISATNRYTVNTERKILKIQQSDKNILLYVLYFVVFWVLFMYFCFVGIVHFLYFVHRLQDVGVQDQKKKYFNKILSSAMGRHQDVHIQCSAPCYSSHFPVTTFGPLLWLLWVSIAIRFRKKSAPKWSNKHKILYKHWQKAVRIHKCFKIL